MTTHDSETQESLVKKISIANGAPRWGAISIGTTRADLQRTLKSKLEVGRDSYGQVQLETYGTKYFLPDGSTSIFFDI